MTHASAGKELTSSVIPAGRFHHDGIMVPDPAGLAVEAPPEPEGEGDDRYIRTQIQKARS